MAAARQLETLERIIEEEQDDIRHMVNRNNHEPLSIPTSIDEAYIPYVVDDNNATTTTQTSAIDEAYY